MAILKNKMHSNNYKAQSVPNNTGFDNFHFFKNYQNQGHSTEGKEDEATQNFSVSQYPIYKI